MEVVLTSLMMEAFHANVMSSTISMAEQDRIDIPTLLCNWIHPSHAYRRQESLWLVKIAQDPGGKSYNLMINRGIMLKSFSTWLP